MNILTYGAQKLSLTKNLMSKLEACRSVVQHTKCKKCKQNQEDHAAFEDMLSCETCEVGEKSHHHYRQTIAVHC